MWREVKKCTKCVVRCSDVVKLPLEVPRPIQLCTSFRLSLIWEKQVIRGGVHHLAGLCPKHTFQFKEEMVPLMYREFSEIDSDNSGDNSKDPPIISCYETLLFPSTKNSPTPRSPQKPSSGKPLSNNLPSLLQRHAPPKKSSMKSPPPPSPRNFHLRPQSVPHAK